MKKVSILAASAGLVVLMGAAYASPTGVTIAAEGGAGYVLDGSLSGVQASAPAVTGTYPVTPQYGNSVKPVTRGEVDYFFNNDPTNSWAFGMGAGYNYFFSSTSNASFFTRDGFDDPYNINGNLKTSAWSTDLDFLISEDISKNASLIYRLGVAYEDMSRKFTASSVSSDGRGEAGRFAANADESVSGFGGLLGVGMQYNFTKDFGMRIEFDAMKGGKDIGYAQALAGLTYSF